jgi:AraC family transcriptional regulator
MDTGKQAPPALLPAASGARATVAIDTEVFRVSRVAFAPGRLPRHYHDRACLTVVLRGSFLERFATRAVDCRPGGILIKPPGESHSDEFAGSSQIIIEPDARALKKLDGAERAFRDIFCERSALAAALGQRIAGELEVVDEFTSLAVEGLALELLADACRAGVRADRSASRAPAWLARVRERLDDEHRHVTLSELAALAAVHPAYLARLFRRCYGVSIGRYARQARLDRVAGQLLESDEPLSLIAIGAGFADQSHLTRVFRTHRGSTPGQYRRRFKRS